MKKVYLLIESLSGGGAERAVSNISLNLNKDINKNIILFGSKAKIGYPYDGSIEYLDVMNLSNPLKKMFALLNRIKKLKKIKYENPEITVISFLEYSNLLNIFTIKNGKSIISVRNHMSTKYKVGIKAFIWNNSIKLMYSKADQIVVVSKAIKKDLIENYGILPDKITVIYNSYPLKQIRELSNGSLRQRYRSIFDSPVIVTTGRLNKQKGYWYLIRVFSEVKKKIKDAKLVVLGEGVMLEELEELARELQIENDVHFLGFQENPFVYLKNSNVFVMSSLHEGFPNAMAEAMACGLPIVSTDCLSGPREILAPDEYDNHQINYDISKKRYGILSPVFDGKIYKANETLTKEEQIMARNITEVLGDTETAKYFSNMSLKRVEDFNANRNIKQWEKII